MREGRLCLVVWQDEGRQRGVSRVSKCRADNWLLIVIRRTDQMPGTRRVSAVSPRCNRFSAQAFSRRSGRRRGKATLRLRAAGDFSKAVRRYRFAWQVTFPAA